MSLDKLLPGSVFGGALLVAGCCIGGGMLALPILTGLAGFFPSLLLLFVCCGFMTYTGLLLIEATGWFYGEVDLISMAEASLGWVGKWVGWLSYLFLFYSLLFAYLAASGSICSAALSQGLGLAIPSWASSIFFTIIFGWIIYLGTRPVDLCNRLLMLGLVIFYLGMLILGLPYIHLPYLFHSSFSAIFPALPVLIVSFGFQNMIPSLSAYMKGDMKRVKQALFGGSLMALAIYVVWILLVLGVVPLDKIQENYSLGLEATHALSGILGTSWISHFATGFAFFAVITSFLTIGLGLIHFLADGLKVPVHGKMRIPLCFIAIFPPLVLSLIQPQIFFKALSFAGGICAMILFGIFPVAMAWIGRYRKNLTSNYHAGGGKLALLATLGFALLVIFCELARFF